MATREELTGLIGGGGGGGGGVPVYFASTHGAYEVREGKSNMSVPFRVPRDTYIFEAASVGEKTITTIDMPLWQLIQNRREFAAYINSDEAAVDPLKKAVLNNLHYYKPGDIIFIRTLVLEPDNEFDYQWGYYRFLDGMPPVAFPKEGSVNDYGLMIADNIANPPLTDSMKEIRNEHFPYKKGLRGAARVESTNYKFIEEARRRDGNHGPSIFIFSSCASFWASSPMSVSEEKLTIDIGRAQQQADLNFLEMGFSSGPLSAGGRDIKSTLLSYDRFKSLKSDRRGREPEEFAPAARKNHVLTEVDHPEELFLSRIGKKDVRVVEARHTFQGIPPGAVSVFQVLDAIGNTRQVPGKTNPSWWTTEELSTAIDEKQPLYVYSLTPGKRELIPIVDLRRAGIYTGRLRNEPKQTNFYKPAKGGRRTRRFLKKFKRTRNYKRSRRTP